MKYFEIILKILFLVISVSLIMTLMTQPSHTSEIASSIFFLLFSLISLTLGSVLIFNKQSSYGLCNSKDYLIRRIEGVLLICCGVVPMIYLAESILALSSIN